MKWVLVSSGLLAWVVVGAAGCDTRGCVGPERDWGSEEANRRNAPKIPWRDRVGCDVCPVECMDYDLNHIPEHELFAAFRREVGAWDEEEVRYLNGTPTEELMRLHCIALRGEPAILAELDSMLDEPDPEVSYAVAWLALYRNTWHSRALDTLKRLKREAPQPVRGWSFMYVRTYELYRRMDHEGRYSRRPTEVTR